MFDRLLTPPNYTDLSDEAPLVFLAGPIQGSQDWQTPMARDLLASNERLLVASPRRSEIDENFNKRKQVEWELDHLWYASQLGGVAFWFAAHDNTLPYQEGRSHAQTSRVEIGSMLTLKRITPSTRLWVGFDTEYTKNGSGSEEYIRIANGWFTGRDKIYDSLEDMTEAISSETAEL